MANVLARRLFNQNLSKFAQFVQVPSQHYYCNVIFVNEPKSQPLLKRDGHQKSVYLPMLYPHVTQVQTYCKKVDVEPNKSPSLFERLKRMYKDYWYVLLPVHLVTSAAWFGGFYYLVESGVDIVAILEYWNISEKIINPLKDSSMGYIALAYALYKISTPIRYTVTLGGTTISINYLTKWGYIKPVPSKEMLKKIYHERKDNIIETMRETREDLKDKKEHIMEDLDKSLKQIKNMGGQIKRADNVRGLKKKMKNHNAKQ